MILIIYWLFECASWTERYVMHVDDAASGGDDDDHDDDGILHTVFSLEDI